MTSKKTHFDIKLLSPLPPVLMVLCLVFISLSALNAAPMARVAIATETGNHSFDVEVMSTPSERAKGLMFRKSLPADRGMLFDFAENTTIRMWMKNTYLSLDMIFIDSSGRIIDISTNTVPHSTDIIRAGGPARYVLEVIAGSSARIGARIGDRVTFEY